MKPINRSQQRLIFARFRPSVKIRGVLAITSIITLALSACATSPKAAKKDSKIPFFGSMVVERFVLPNGLKLIVLEDPSSPTFAYQTWFRVGSRDENVQYTGLAHLFEHMMFKGTKNVPPGQLDRILEQAGAEGENAFTSRDYTAYVQELPKDKLDLIVKLESDRMVNLIVDDKSFKTETEVVQNERRFRNENSPDGLMYQEIFGVAFKTHPYRWPVIGYAEDLARMTGKDGVEFYKNYYAPNHATIVVVGDVKAGEVYSAVKKAYGSFGAKAAPVKDIPAEPVQTKPRHKTMKLNTQVEKLMVAYPVPPVTHEDIPALEVMRTVLSGGKSARLSRALVDGGITTSIDTFDLDDKDPSILIFMANLQRGKKAATAERILLEQIEKFKQDLVTPSELERAKNTLQASFYDGLSTPSGKAHFIGHFETVSSGLETGVDLFSKIGNVTAAEIQTVARKYLKPNARSVVTGVQK